MKLIEALELLKRPVPDLAPGLKVSLACGFTPLHMQTFLRAHLRGHFPLHRIEIGTGLFGDLVGNIERLTSSGANSLVALVEWGDLDPRLSIRNLGSWRPSRLHDIVDSVRQATGRLEEALLQAARILPAVVCMPTLPLPPISWTRPVQESQFEVQLRQCIGALAASLSEQNCARIVNAQILDELSPLSDRMDVRSEVSTGFPYRIGHASVLGQLIAELIRNPLPKKGLITDLDDTLWSGMVGEDGVDGISWHLDRHAQMHGLYQQFLASLAETGILVGVASKNNPAIVEQAFQREGMLISKNEIFPFEIHWSHKSESVERILRTWNVGAGSVVFIDDSPMEVAEVKAAFPEMECILFPKDDPQGIWDLLKQLRGIFGKTFLTEDDSRRLDSIRNSAAWRRASQSPAGSSDDFLRAAEASIVFDCSRQPGDVRAFELINKTNQFNLNGKRLSESEWRRFFDDPEAFLLTLTYRDKYGSLGKVAVLMGRSTASELCVKHWVMSCRAFSRRIEHQCVNRLFEAFGSDQIFFDYMPTPKNGPLQDFFTSLLGAVPASQLWLSKEQFLKSVPALYHHVEGIVDA
jgi:FkbH-like protein